VAPGFELPDQKGNLQKLSDFRGRAVLLAFWAPWAGPCRLSLPQWGRMSKKYAKQGLAVVIVTLFDDAGQAVKVLKESGVSFPALTGTDAVTKTWFGRSEIVLPVVFLLDGRGRVVRRIAGFQRAEDLEPVIEKALATVSPPAGSGAAR
jgi:peroxiredoxin